MLLNTKWVVMFFLLAVKINCEDLEYCEEEDANDKNVKTTEAENESEEEDDESEGLVKQGGMVKLEDLAEEIKALVDLSKKKDNSSRYWGHWSEWGDCSVSCGQGRKVRWRNCTKEECPNGNVEMETKICQLPACSHTPEVSAYVGPIGNVVKEVASNISSGILNFFSMFEDKREQEKPR